MKKQTAKKGLESEVAALKAELSTAVGKIDSLEKLLKAASVHETPWQAVANWWNGPSTE